MSHHVAGLLLAAGAGRRMGRPKALLDLHGEAAVCRALDVLRDGGCARTVVVIGADAAQVAPVARGCATDAHIVVNDDWVAGMGGSMALGLRHIIAGTPQARGVMIHLVDQPRVGAAVVARLIDTATRDWDTEAPAPAAWAASYQGRRRTPVLFDAAVADDLVATAHGDAGARDWLDAHGDRVALVPCEDLGAPEDLDTPADLAAYLSHPASEPHAS